MEFKVGQIFRTKKGHRLDIVEVRETSVDVLLYVHRSSQNCKSYGWGHNTKWFRQSMPLDGRMGIIEKIKKEGYKLDKPKKVVASVTKD
ncbi:MAG: hypothetical protein SLAVMIC_00984 [uncultured marine phage]|uniref:DUF1653 domain-containing protein n=1 Tax=uncultured marine phage TaxID=707152 RepID=A0A8D9FR90_9VIRU|nr:MAG: hypothetical protein SLAVMIC_00984 [uncultured marine phage]